MYIYIINYTTYYQKNKEEVLNKAKDYYQNDKERFREQASNKYRNLPEEEKIKRISKRISRSTKV